MDGSHRRSVVETAAQLARARLKATALKEYPGPLPPDLAAAYEYQHAALEQWPAGVVGWKVARIAPEWHQQFPEERLIGPILAGRLYRYTPGRITECPVIEGGFAAVEAELGVFVGADAASDRLGWTSDSAAEMVDEVCTGVEIASSPVQQINDLGPAAVISDFGNNWGAVAGPTLERWPDSVEPLEVVTRIDDVIVGSATISIRKTVLAAFAFALNKAAQLGRPLRAGQYVSTGMITGVHDIHAGQDARISFGPGGSRGEIVCRMTRSTPIVAEIVRS